MRLQNNEDSQGLFGAQKTAHRDAAALYTDIHVGGHLSTPALQHAIAELGPDRIMFSTDYPFEDVLNTAERFDNSGIGAEDQVKIGRTNAIQLLKL